MNTYHLVLERQSWFKLKSSRLILAESAERAWDIVVEEEKRSKGSWAVITIRRVE